MPPAVSITDLIVSRIWRVCAARHRHGQRCCRCRTGSHGVVRTRRRLTTPTEAGVMVLLTVKRIHCFSSTLNRKLWGPAGNPSDSTECSPQHKVMLGDAGQQRQCVMLFIPAGHHRSASPGRGWRRHAHPAPKRAMIGCSKRVGTEPQARAFNFRKSVDAQLRSYASVFRRIGHATRTTGQGQSPTIPFDSSVTTTGSCGLYADRSGRSIRVGAVIGLLPGRAEHGHCPRRPACWGLRTREVAFLGRRGAAAKSQ